MSIRYLSGINVDNNTLFVDSANDRVGIGTGSPTYKLDIIGEGRTSSAFMAGGAINIDSNLAIQISSAGAGTQRWIGINKNNGYGLIIGYVENAAALNGVGAYIRQVTSDPIHFLIDNATTAMSIVSGGNVLIGTTTNDGRKLQVSGSGIFAGQLLVSADSGNEQFIIRRASNNNEQLIFGFHSSDYGIIQAVEQLVGYRPISLNPNGGNIGINTTTPTSPLEITNSGSTGGGTSMYISSYSATKQWGTRTYGVDNGSGIAWWSDVQFSSTWYNAIRIGHGQNAGNPSFRSYFGTVLASDGGNVLIGTTTDAGYKLDVNGSLRTGANGMAIDSSGFASTPNANTPWNAFRYSHPQNIIPNGDLESWTSGTSTAPDGFGGYDLGASTIITRESSIVKQGTYSAKILNPSGAAFSGMSYALPRVDKTPGSSSTSEYTISFWHYAPTSNGGVSYFGVYSNTAAAYVVIQQMPTSSGWTFYSRTFSIRDDSNFDLYWWVSWGSGTANDVVYIDSIAFNKGNQLYESTQSSVSRTGNVTRWGDFYNLGGNVGIGTTSPSYKTSVVAANGNYWNGTAFTGTPLAISIENSQAGGYDPVLIYNQADSAGTLKNSGAIGMVGTAAWTAGDNAAQVSDMYFLVRNSSGALQERARLKSNGHLILKSATSGGGTQGDFYVIENGGLVIDASEGATQRYIEFTTGGTSKALITAGGNFLIGTTTDAGYKLRVNGGSYFDAPILSYTGNGYITAITSDGVGSNNGFGYSFLIAGTNHEIGRVTGIYETSGGGGSGGLGFWTRASGTLSAKMTLNSGGTLTLSNYGAGTKTGTVAYNLAVDASGNVIETAGGVVDGSGTANQLARWQDANTLTNAGIEDNGSAISIGRDAFYSSTNYGTAYAAVTGASGGTAWFDTVTTSSARLYNITIFANPNASGSGSYKDFYYGKIIVGNGYNGSAVVDFINYHQESPQPRSLYGSGGGNLTVTAVFVYGGSEVTEVPSGATYTIRIKIAGYVAAGAGTQINLQRIM